MTCDISLDKTAPSGVSLKALRHAAEIEGLQAACHYGVVEGDRAVEAFKKSLRARRPWRDRSSPRSQRHHDAVEGDRGGGRKILPVSARRIGSHADAAQTSHAPAGSPSDSVHARMGLYLRRCICSPTASWRRSSSKNACRFTDAVAVTPSSRSVPSVGRRRACSANRRSRPVGSRRPAGDAPTTSPLLVTLLAGTITGVERGG